MEKDPKVTIVMPVYNEEKLVSNAIQSLSNQTYKDIEIIVIDDGSTDKTVEKVKQFPSVRLIKKEHGGTGKAWNMGAELATGKIMVLFAGDMQAPKDYIEKLVRPIIKGEAKGTLHDMEYILNSDNTWARCWAARWGKRDGKYVSFISGTPSGWTPNFEAILIDEYLRRGGMDPKRGYADDQSIGERNFVKFKIVYDCFLHHNYPSSLKETFFQARWVGGSMKLRNLWKKAVLGLVGIFLYFILMLNPFPQITGSVIGPLTNMDSISITNSILILLGVIILAILLNSLRVAIKVKDPQLFLPYNLFFITKITGNVIGYFRKLLFKKYAR